MAAGCPRGHPRVPPSRSRSQIRARWIRDSRRKPGQEPLSGLTQGPGSSPGPGERPQLRSAGKSSGSGAGAALSAPPASSGLSSPKNSLFPPFFQGAAAAQGGHTGMWIPKQPPDEGGVQARGDPGRHRHTTHPSIPIKNLRECQIPVPGSPCTCPSATVAVPNPGMQQWEAPVSPRTSRRRVQAGLTWIIPRDSEQGSWDQWLQTHRTTRCAPNPPASPHPPGQFISGSSSRFPCSRSHPGRSPAALPHPVGQHLGLTSAPKNGVFSAKRG